MRIYLRNIKSGVEKSLIGDTFEECLKNEGFYSQVVESAFVYMETRPFGIASLDEALEISLQDYCSDNNLIYFIDKIDYRTKKIVLDIQSQKIFFLGSNVAINVTGKKTSELLVFMSDIINNYALDAEIGEDITYMWGDLAKAKYIASFDDCQVLAEIVNLDGFREKIIVDSTIFFQNRE